MLAQRLKQRVQRQIVATAQRKFGSHHNATTTTSSPHYADFGYAPHQMLPPHEFMRHPVRPEATTMPHYYKYNVGFSQTAEGVPTTGAPTGLALSWQTEWACQYTNKIVNRFVMRSRAIKYYLALITIAFSYEAYMHGGFRGPTQSIWDNVAKINKYNGAHSLQWEKSWDEFRELPEHEVDRVLENRPFFRKNPYIITKVEEEIAARKKGEMGPLSSELEQQKLGYAMMQVADEHAFLKTWKLLDAEQRLKLAPLYSDCSQAWITKIAVVMKELKDLKCPEVEEMVEQHQAIINREKSEKYARSLKFIEAKLDL